MTIHNDSLVRRGQVIGIADGRARIRLEPSAGCSGCGSRGSCASGNAKPQMVEMAMPTPVQAGDVVSVAVPAASLTTAAVLGYLLPPVALLSGAIGAEQLYSSDLAAVIGAGVGLAAGVLAARLGARFTFGNVAALATCHSDYQPGDHP